MRSVDACHGRSCECDVGFNHRGWRRSIQSRIRERHERSTDKSSASSTRPSGSIQTPRIGRKERMPPRISRTPAGMRNQRQAGRRKKRTVRPSLGGKRLMSLSRRQSSRAGWRFVMSCEPQFDSESTSSLRKRRSVLTDNVAVRPGLEMSDAPALTTRVSATCSCACCRMRQLRAMGAHFGGQESPKRPRILSRTGAIAKAASLTSSGAV